MYSFETIPAYCKAIKIAPPKHDHFDIRSFEENMSTIRAQMPAFRHSFYAIALKIKGKGAAVASHHRDFPDGDVVFFNSPFQVLSWDISPDWGGYYLMLTEDFLTNSLLFNDLLGRFPFLKIEESIPFRVREEEAQEILNIFGRIYAEYHGQEPDKFDIISSNVLLLLYHIRRYFNRQFPPLMAQQALRKADVKLLSRYQKLIELKLRDWESFSELKNLHSPSYYAQLLHVHPNHLNAVVKDVSGQTALQIIHKQLIYLAKSYLVQTSWSIKEIAYRLQFDAPNNFNNFFKKHTNCTPGSFRKKAPL